MVGGFLWSTLAVCSEDRSMASNAASQIARVLDPVLKEGGYRRRGLNWYRYGVDSVLLVNVQRARYTSGAYINLGVYYYIAI
jgi:Domain of unknown function (DUF4304)